MLASLPVALIVIALVLTVASATGRAPLWPAVFVLCVVLLLGAWPK